MNYEPRTSLGSKDRTAKEAFDEGIKNNKGKTVTQSDQEAFKWHKLSAEKGLAEAQFLLGKKYGHGISIDQSSAMAYKWYKLAADQGHGEACYCLFGMYATGNGVQQNFDEAIRYLQLSANTDYSPAQYALGTIYYNGEYNVEKNQEAGLRWLLLSAKQENGDAQNFLGSIYLNGNGVQVDYEKALTWFKLAVRNGNAFAQNDIGLMYSHGYGVPQNKGEAIKYFKLSAKQGISVAQDNLERLGVLDNDVHLNNGLEMTGAWMYQIDFIEKKIKITGEYIENNASEISGPMELRFFLTRNRYDGGDITGWPIVVAKLNPLDGKNKYKGINIFEDYHSMPGDGVYYATLCLFAKRNNIYYIRKYLNFDGTVSCKNNQNILQKIGDTLIELGSTLNTNNREEVLTNTPTLQNNNSSEVSQQQESRSSQDYQITNTKYLINTYEKQIADEENTIARIEVDVNKPKVSSSSITALSYHKSNLIKLKLEKSKLENKLIHLQH
jgi:TPR repeat protein